MASEHVGDISEALFDAEVIERSHRQPVLVDFWAAWCGPCRMLGPILEKVADDMEGAFYLAKVNTEECQSIAAQYRISGIPAVKLFAGGKVIAEFTGALPESQVRAFLKENLPSEAGAAVEQGKTLVASGQLDEARQSFERALELDEGLHDARLELARLLLRQGAVDEVAPLLDPIGKNANERDAADALLALSRFAAGGTSDEELETRRTRAVEASSSAEAQLRLGELLAARGQYEEALEALLASVVVDRKFEDEAARRAMLSVFEVVGARSELANRFRRKLSIYS